MLDRRFARLGFSLSDNLKIIDRKIDNRRTSRRPCDAGAWIRAEGCFATQQCRILDLSQIGAGLTVVDVNRIPSRFILFLSKNDRGRRASIKWRRGSRIGAEFLAV